MSAHSGCRCSSGGCRGEVLSQIEFEVPLSRPTSPADPLPAAKHRRGRPGGSQAADRAGDAGRGRTRRWAYSPV